MLRSSSDSILNTLKGRIWLAVSALAVLNCVLGFVSYLVVAYFTTNAFFTVFFTFFLLAFITMVFGWWLSNEVTRPIETVTLLAKSLERSASASLPRTTGSSETDELLRSLHRNNRQVQNIVAAMDHVSAGRTDLSEFAFETGDRMAVAFQKLVSKISESISARQELDALLLALRKLESDASACRNGDLSGDIRSDEPAIKGIADTLRTLSNRLAKIVERLQTAAAATDRSISEIRKGLQAALDQSDDSSVRLTSSLSKLQESAHRRKDSVDHVRSILAAEAGTREEAPERSAGQAAENLDHLRALVAEAAKKVQQLRGRMTSIPLLGRGAQEISRRASLVSINAGLKPLSAANGTRSHEPAPVLTREIETISKRSEELMRDLSAAEATVAGDLAEIENTFAALRNLIPAASASVDGQADLARELESRLRGLSTAVSKTPAFSGESDHETAALVESLEQTLNRSSIVDALRTADQLFTEIAAMHADLRSSVADLRPGISHHAKTPANFDPARTMTNAPAPAAPAPNGEN